MLTVQSIQDDRKLRKALDLIKEHITSAETQQNIDLHRAVGLIVDVARHFNLLDHDWSSRLLRDMANNAPIVYACESCAEEMLKGGISDDDGRLIPTGFTGNFYAFCNLCGKPATHEVIHHA